MARHEARYHVLVEVLAAIPPDRTPGEVRVEGRVVELFRSDGLLRAGDKVRFTESVTRPSDSRDTIPIGGTRWKDHDDVLGARFIEAFLNGDPPGCRVALWQSQVVPAPAGAPRMNGRFPDEAESKKRQERAMRSWCWRWLFG